jgi:two-component system sensor kinase FixL
MPQYSAPVAIAPGTSRARPSRSRLHSPRRRAPALSPVRPPELDLGELFVHTRDAVVVGDVLSGRIVLWNPAAERLFGYTAAEAIGQSIDILIAAPIARLHQEGMAHFRRTGHGSIMGSNAPVEVPAMTRAGQEIRVDLSLVALQPSAPGTRYVMAMLRDAADRRRAEIQALESARAAAARTEAEVTVREVSALLSDGITNLSRPIAKLQRSAGRLARTLETADPSTTGRAAKRAHALELRAEAARRAADQLVDCAAIQTGSLQMTLDRVNLVPLLIRVVAAARLRAPSHRLTLAVPQGLTAMVDPLRIERVLTELIDQAMRRSPRGCWIDIDLRRPLAGQARLEVRDYGRPIADEARALLLDRRGPEPALHVCRAIVEAHSGSLTAEHPADSGLRLIATLPAQRGRSASG